MWGEGWVLVKHNEREAIVEQSPLYSLSQSSNMKASASQQPFRVLGFWEKSPDGDSDFISEHIEDLRRRSVEEVENGAARKPSNDAGSRAGSPLPIRGVLSA